VLGLSLWFIWFCATYGGVAVACAVAPPPIEQGPLNWINASVLVLAAFTTAGFAAGARINAQSAQSTRGLPEGNSAARQRFVARVAVALYITAAISTAVVALPALLLAPCL